jgi:GNAT superfamily N-acetyltransferase
MTEKHWTIESAASRDLTEINRVVAEAISAWTVSDRVKRLALPLYHYHLADLEELDFEKALDSNGTIIGIITWGAVGPEDTLGREGEALLHGIYVAPARQALGVGKALFEHARQRAERCGYQGFIVKASKDATGFFERLGLERVESESAKYPYLFWKPFDLNRLRTTTA